jgi:hypothetical protein
MDIRETELGRIAVLGRDEEATILIAIAVASVLAALVAMLDCSVPLVGSNTKGSLPFLTQSCNAPPSMWDCANLATPPTSVRPGFCVFWASSGANSTVGSGLRRTRRHQAAMSPPAEREWLDLTHR